MTGVIGILDRQPRSLSRKDITNLIELARVVEGIFALHEDLQVATNAALHDDTTGLANRAFFRDAIAAAVRDAPAASA